MSEVEPFHRLAQIFILSAEIAILPQPEIVVAWN